MIYEALLESSGVLDFGQRLQRFIYERSDFNIPFEEVTLNDLRSVIMEEFSFRQVPAHFLFDEGSTSLMQLSKYWLQAKGAARETVLLLGFGLGMTLTEVEVMLTKGLLEAGLNPKDPVEALCWYCFKYGLDYWRFCELWERFEALPENSEAEKLLSEKTCKARTRLESARTEAELLAYLGSLQTSMPGKRQSVTARGEFESLFQRIIDIVVKDGSLGKDASQREQSILSYGGSLLENTLYTTVPRDPHGNLTPMKRTRFKDIFFHKRLSRQRIYDIMKGRCPISRYDLMTLRFCLSALDSGKLAPEKRVARFEGDANALLNACGMHDLYDAVPYEIFLKMCMATEDPLCTFADVWELSYAE